MSLNLFTNQLANFIRDNHVPAVDAVEDHPFSDELHELRSAVGHHLIPLLFIARSDRNIAPQESDIIVEHCMAIAARHGVTPDDKHVEALRDYAATFHPALTQLDPAIANLSHGDHEDFAALVDTAQKVVMCDGISRPEEAKFLAKLRDELVKPPQSAA